MREAEELSAEAENAGASSVWVADVRREPFLTSAAALRATASVTVGTDVAVAFSRSPAAPALARGAARAKREAPPVHMPLVVGRDRSSLALQMTTYTVPAYRRVLDESGLREDADAILAAIADRRRTEAARIIEERCLDQLGVAVLDDLPERVRLWRAHADVIGLTVPWYGLDRDAQVALFRDVLRAVERM